MLVSSSQWDTLFACQELQFAYEIFNDLIPQELLSRATTTNTHALLFFSMATQMEQVADNFIGIVGFGDDGVLKGDGVVFARAAGNCDTLGSHHFEGDQTEWLMSTVSKCSIGSGIGSAHKLFGQEETQIVNIGGTSVGNGFQTLPHIRALSGHIANAQARLIGMAQHLGSMRFETPTHKEGDRMTTVFETSNGLYRHDPAFVRVETTDFEEKHAARIALLCNLT